MRFLWFIHGINVHSSFLNCLKLFSLRYTAGNYETSGKCTGDFLKKLPSATGTLKDKEIVCMCVHWGNLLYEISCILSSLPRFTAAQINTQV